MFKVLLSKLRKHSTTAILTAAVLGALYLQLSLLSGELELQRQQYETNVGQMATNLNDRVRLHIRRKSMGMRQTTSTGDSTVTISTPMGTTTLRWSSGQVQNPYGLGGIDTNFLGGIFDNFQSNLPWETQLSYGEMDSIVTAELRAQGINVEPMWSVVENGYLSTLTTEGFNPQLVKFNYVLAESFFGPTRQLLLYFPREGFFLAKRVYLSLLAALLFAAVILIAFFGVQRQGRRQKRLAAVKSDFINNMSHEFKTPLATINLAVDSLMKNGEKMNPERMRSYFEIIKAENKRMNAQMESVLQMSMMDKEELTLDKEWMKLDQLVEEAVDHFRLNVQDRGGWMDLQMAEGSFDFLGDRTQLKSALTNLIDNAIKYSPSAPQISVKLGLNNAHYLVDIKDRGIGMDEETQMQVFDRFFRATKGNIHDVKGHGLGLSFVKEIVEKHRGQITLKSSPGEGTTFTLALPRK
ncbi:MAG: sensor histidine kinase [Schleiferiaceae bacterium]|jgi:two-component system phosphate regulon sensor histidine kinase PhoR